jgi:glycosyltransferase involved in cell wall biosynthesis
MNIAIITELFYPNIGGQEIRYLEISKILAKHGHRIDIFTIDNFGNLPKKEVLDQNIYIYRIINDKHYKPKVIKFLRRNIFTIIRFTVKLFKEIKLRQYNFIIINQWPILPGILGRYIHNNAILDICELRKGVFWKAIQFLLINGCQKIITVNDEIEHYLKEKHKKYNVITIPSGVEIKKFKNIGNNERRYFIFIGRLEKHKNPEQAIEATIKYNSIYKKGETLIIVGNGSLFEQLKLKYSDYENKKIIQFLGFVSEEMKLNILASAKLLLLPSEREGFPRVISECAASGVPVITTDYPNNWAKYIVDKYNIGVVVRPGVDNIVNGIVNCLKNYDFYVKNCMIYKESLNWENIVNNLINFALK